MFLNLHNEWSMSNLLDAYSYSDLLGTMNAHQVTTIEHAKCNELGSEATREHGDSGITYEALLLPVTMISSLAVLLCDVITLQLHW